MSEKSKLWYLENMNMFNELSTDELMTIEQKTTMKTLSKNEYIYFPEEPSTVVFFLKEGRVKIGSFTEDGREVIKTILGPGEVFGEMSIAGEDKRSDFAQVMDASVKICAMSGTDMENMMASNPNLSLKVTKLMGFRLKKIERKFEAIIGKDARGRIIDFIKDTALESGKKVGDEILIKHYLTHQDIANLTATSRQTVTTVLNELREKNLIYFERKKILIRDIEKLK